MNGITKGQKPIFMTLLAPKRANIWKRPKPRSANPIRYMIRLATNPLNMNRSDAITRSTTALKFIRREVLSFFFFKPTTSETTPEAKIRAAMIFTTMFIACSLYNTMMTPIATATSALIGPLSLLEYPNVNILLLLIKSICKFNKNQQ